MILPDVIRLSALSAIAASLAAPAFAQTVPMPHPRPAHLTAAAPKTSAVAAPATITDIVAAAAPAPSEPAPAAEPSAPAAETSAPPVEIAAAPVSDAANPLGRQTQAQTLERVNTYFNGIRTLVGNFTQLGPDGSKMDGKFFLAKPGRVRFYYQQPSNTDVIADGKSLVVRDRKLATQDVYPLGQTPLKFLLDTNLDLARDSKVVAVYQEPGLISVAIEEETSFGGKARVLIVFGTEDQQTFELKQWTITDPQGLDTTVAVSQLDTSTKPDDKLFAVDYTRDIVRR